MKQHAMSTTRLCTVSCIVQVIVLFVAAPVIQANEFYVVPLHVYSDDPAIEVTSDEEAVSDLLFQAIRATDTAGLLAFRFVSDEGVTEIPRSTLDAALVSEELQVRFLLYGFVKKTSDYYDAQLRLFDNESKQDQRVFYAKVGRDAFPMISENLASQASLYIRDLLGVTPERIEARRRFGGLGIHGSLGYWFPMGQWGDLLSGIVTAGSGASIVPVTPLYRRDDLSFYFRYGLYLSYGLGINKPEFVDAFLHSALIRTPIEAAFEYRFNHVAYFGFGPMLRVDVVSQARLYDETVTEVIAVPGMTVRFGYEYWFSAERDFAVGIQPSLDAAFYDTPFLATTVQLYTVFQLDWDERTPVSASVDRGDQE